MTNDLRNSVANGSQTNPRLLPAARMSTVVRIDRDENFVKKIVFDEI